MHFCISGNIHVRIFRLKTGIVTPIVFIGATSGSFFSDMSGVDKATFSALGLVSLLAGAANIPIAASIMALELFGPKLGPYAAIACVVSSLMTGHRSVFPSRMIDFRKSSFITWKRERRLKM